MENKKEKFMYSYSAKQQEEIKNIRQKYLPREENKMEQLRRLDQSVTKPGMVAAIGVGSVSTLILGLGMCCVMVWKEILFIPGIVIGIIGIAGIAAAFPLYQEIMEKQREKLAPEIIKLTDELMKQ